MTRALIVYVALTALTLAVFACGRALTSRSRISSTTAAASSETRALDRFGRDFFRVTPFVVLALYAGLWLAKRRGVALKWAPSGRAVIFLIATIAIGPGLIVNLGLKDHWHRPRPVHTQEFGGPDAFRPWYDDRGACKKNCSFVSGEAATGFWMVAPASVLPPPWRTPAIVAAFVFGVCSSLLRMAFGGHLSLRCAARRARLADRHRNRAAAPLAARRRMTPLRSPGNETGTEAIRTGHDGRAETRLARREPPAYKPALAASRGLVGV